MVEENLRQHLVYERWMVDANWLVVREAFFDSIPGLLRGMITKKIRKKVLRSLTSHGVAQFSETERTARATRDLATVVETLDDKPFLFGETPTAADAAIAPVLDMIRTLPTDGQLRQLVCNQPRLIAYVDRARDAIYPK